VAAAAGAEVVERLLAALRDRDEEAVAVELHPDVEAIGRRGTKRGIDAVVAWAKPSVDGALVSAVEVDEIREIGSEWVAVAARRLWRWSESRELADEEPFGVLFRVCEGRVVSWDQTHRSLAGAIDAIPA
jgi:CO dehydrogenase nickel-insertion accessory protein CooC1